MRMPNASRGAGFGGAVLAAVLGLGFPGGAFALTLNSSADLLQLDYLDLLRPGVEESAAPSAGLPFAQALELLNAGRYEAAVKVAREAVARSPRSAAGRELLGAALVKSGDLAGGLKELSEAVSIEPSRHTAWTKIGDVHLAQKRIPQAREAFLRAVALDPADRLPHQRLGLLLAQEGDLRGAVEQFEKGLVGAPPGYVGIKIDLGNLYNRLGEFGKAVSLLAPAVPGEGTEKNPSLHLVLGTAYLGQDRTDEALREFETVRRLEPEAARGHLAMGIVLRARKDLPGSLAELTAAVKLGPKLATAHYQLGETLARMGRLGEAIDSYQTARGLEPGNAPVLRALALAYSLQGRRKEAVDAARALVTARPADPDSHTLLGSLLQDAGDTGGAKKAYREALSRDPAQPLANNNLAFLLAREGKLDEAAELAARAAQEMPASGEVLDTWGWILSRKGDPRARATLEKAASLSPRNPVIFYHLGSHLHGAGDKAAARPQLEKALSLSGSFEGAEKAREMLAD